MTEPLQSMAEAVADLECVSAVALVGSVARGFADDRSDLDLAVFCSSIPDASVLRSTFDAIGAEPREHLLWDHDAIGTCSFLRYDGVEFDVTYYETARFRERIEAVLRGDHPPPARAPHDVAFGRSEEFLAGMVRIAEPLVDEDGYLVDLKSSVEPYPEPLRRRNVRDSYFAARFYVDRKLEKAACRGDFFQCNSGTARVLRHLIRVLFAVNGRYFVGDKHNEACLDTFDHLPEGFEETLFELRATDEHDLVRRIELLDDLVDRTGSLLDDRGLLAEVKNPL